MNTLYCQLKHLIDEKSQIIKKMKLGEFIIKNRHNRRIKVCGGCNKSIADMRITPPHDIILLTKENTESEKIN